jgi:multiple sugar transport system ATP-binding protein
MTMGHRVAVMRKGELQQVDAPQVLYDHPDNLFVAGFIGSPAMNLLEGTLARDEAERLMVVAGGLRLALDDELVRARGALASFVGKPLIVGIRPESIDDAAIVGDHPRRRLHGEVLLRESLGSEVMVHLAVDAPQAVTDEVRELAHDVGRQAPGATERQKAVVVGRFNARSRVATGATARAVVDTRSLHFFDPQTGLGIYDAAAVDSKELNRS